MALNLSKRIRIVLLFLLGIALPSLLFHSSGSIPSPGLSSLDPSVVRMLQQGQHLEFQKNDYRKALAIYRQALRRASDPHTRGDGKSFLYAAE